MASAKEIPPGGDGKIKVTFKTSNKSGERTQIITIATDDPENPVIRLKVRAEVEVKLEAKPDRINFGQIKKGTEPLPQYVSLNGEDKDTTEILSVSSKNKHIKVEIASPDSADRHKPQRVKVSVLPGMEVGKFMDKITIKTDHKTMEVLSATLYGEVIGNIAVIPNYLSFGMFKRGEKHEKSVRLRSTPRVSFNILDVKSTTPDVKAKLITIKEGFEYMVQVSTDENFKGNFLSGKVLITTNEPDQAEIEVKVFGRTFP
ncbi:MAG: DUF1573 domain-containing protein [Proteobacteria bacterium]|nr:DUF1573 domain-containing protein [Pseudomonadota bacterium]MBU4009637.1 DUF1573 domain-containing protein [Pseudomonadota bacterium]